MRFKLKFLCENGKIMENIYGCFYGGSYGDAWGYIRNSCQENRLKITMEPRRNLHWKVEYQMITGIHGRLVIGQMMQMLGY